MSLIDAKPQRVSDCTVYEAVRGTPRTIGVGGHDRELGPSNDTATTERAGCVLTDAKFKAIVRRSE